MVIIATALIIVGMIICVVFGFLLLMQAFEESTGWGLAYIFIPFANLFFVIKFWDETKRNFGLALLGLVIAMVGVMMHPDAVWTTESSFYLGTDDF